MWSLSTCDFECNRKCGVLVLTCEDQILNTTEPGAIFDKKVAQQKIIAFLALFHL